jgi:hypothetical protein
MSPSRRTLRRLKVVVGWRLVADGHRAFSRNAVRVGLHWPGADQWRDAEVKPQEK